MTRRLAPFIVLLVVALALRAHAGEGILDDAEIGILAHDVPIGVEPKETGADASGEVRFVSPGFLAPIFAPRPHLGINLNSAGGNSYAYAGLTWTADFLPPLFASLGLGGAVHNGPDVSASENHKGLGTRALFHEYVELGAHLAAPWSAALFLDHVSNADIGRHNPGLSNLGIRIGYAF